MTRCSFWRKTTTTYFLKRPCTQKLKHFLNILLGLSQKKIKFWFKLKGLDEVSDRKWWQNAHFGLKRFLNLWNYCHFWAKCFHRIYFISWHELSVSSVITPESSAAARYKTKPQDYHYRDTSHHLLLITNESLFLCHYQPYLNPDRFAVTLLKKNS